jgi:hypothetical protein
MRLLCCVGCCCWRYQSSKAEDDAWCEEDVVDKFNSLETHCLGPNYHFSGSVQ